MSMVPIHELFGPTIQGEGRWCGKLVNFVRLSGCPVGCPWCDTGYANGGKGLPREYWEVTDIVESVTTTRAVISGGEPYIHRNLPELVTALVKAGKTVAIETSGAFWQPIGGVWVTLSPKHHVSAQYPVRPEFWSRADEVKLVVETGQEPDFYGSLLRQFKGPVYLQPQWENLEGSLVQCLDLLEQHPDWTLSIQSHKFLGVR